jgi:hypothetical protein
VFAIALVFAVVLMILLAAALVVTAKTLGPALMLFAAISAAFVGSILIVARFFMDVAAV